MSKFAVVLASAFLWSGALQADHHEEGEMHPPDPAEMFGKMDLNGDGTVEHDEFMEFAASMPMHDDGGMPDCGDLEHKIREQIEHEMHQRMEEHWQQEQEQHREHMHHEIQEMRGHAERMQDELRQHGDDVRREVEHIQGEIARMEEELQMMDEEGGPDDMGEHDDMGHDDGGDHDDHGDDGTDHE